MNDKSLKRLRNLAIIDWKINRSHVNLGMRIVEKYYDELDAVMEDNPQIAWVIRSLKAKVDDARKREAQKEFMDSDDFKEIVEAIWVKIEDEVEAYSYEYKNLVHENLKRLAVTYKEYLDMSTGEQREKYPRGFHNTRGTHKFYDAYMTLGNKKTLERTLEKRREGFITKEKAKLEKLVFRTIDKLGMLSNPRIGEYDDFTMSIVVDTPTDKDIFITLDATPAGGYNIQRFHYRWLSKFTKDGKTYKIK